jgi:hypothetical protein
MRKRIIKKPDGAAKADAAPSAASAPRTPKNAIPQVLAELEEACKHVGVRLTYEAIGGELGSGGLCKVKGQWRAIIDKRTTPAERVALLLPMLSRFPVEEAPLSETSRELIERVRQAPPPSAAASAVSAAS